MNKKILAVIVNILVIIVVPVGLLITMVIFLNQGKGHALLIYPLVIVWWLICGIIFTLREKKVKKLQKEEYLNSLSQKEFKEISFKKRNDTIVDMILENAKVYIKESECAEKVIIKIEFLTNEMINEIPIDFLHFE